MQTVIRHYVYILLLNYGNILFCGTPQKGME